MSVVFSGGFAVIRDSFWTGKLSKVGVFRSIGKGIAANFLYAVASVVIIAFGVVWNFYVLSLGGNGNARLAGNRSHRRVEFGFCF